MIHAKPFLLIRHGETVMNALKLTCGGGVDTELNDTGWAQAELAAKALFALPVKPTLIINSGMRRTRETTSVLNRELGLPVLEDNDLREHMMGEWEQLPWAESFPHLINDDKPKGGESTSEYAARVRSTLDKNLKAHASERILFVAHGGTFHGMLRSYQYDRWEAFIPNATLHAFEPEPKHEPMPWKITLHQWEKDTLLTSAAPICPSVPYTNTSRELEWRKSAGK
ncbi:MAG TPA: histidine phosphatase family protein [Alphaproteobacteria bacterium]